MTNFDDPVLDGGTLAGVGIVGKKRLTRKEQKHAELFKEQLAYLQKAGLSTKFIDNYIDQYNTKGWSDAQYWLMDEVDRLKEERAIGDIRNSVARKRRKMFKAPVDIAKEVGEGAWEGVKEVGKGIGNAFMAFGNAQLAGESGPTASALYAAGNIYNPKTRQFEQTEENIKETEGLRNNLATLGAGSVAAMALPAAASIGGGATGGTTAVSSLPAYTPYALTTAEKIGNFVVPVGLSMVAGEGFNDLTRATSGKTLAQEIGSYFPEGVRPYAEFAGEFLNPGYWFGGAAVKPLAKGLNYVANGVDKAKGTYEYYKFMKNPAQYAQKNNMSNSVVFDNNGVPKMVYTNGQAYSYDDIVNMAKARNHSTDVAVSNPQIAQQIVPSATTRTAPSAPKRLTGEVMGQRRLLPEPVSFERFREGAGFNNPDVQRIYDRLYFNVRNSRLSDNNSLIASVQDQFENPNSVLYRRSINDLMPNELQLTNGNIRDAFNLYKLNNIVDPVDSWGPYALDNTIVRLLGRTSEGTVNVNHPLFEHINPAVRKRLTLSPEQQNFIQGLDLNNWDPSNNDRLLSLYREKVPSVFTSNVESIVRNIQDNRGMGIPSQYEHFNMREYNPKVPLKYYYGHPHNIPNTVDDIQRINGGFPSQSATGLLTDADISQIASDPYVLDKLSNFSPDFEGVLGQNSGTMNPLNFVRNQLENKSQILRERSQQMKDQNRLLTSGVVIKPYSLSLDSYQIWENNILKLLKQGKAGSLPKSSFVNNSWAREMLQETDPNLVKWLRENPTLADHLSEAAVTQPDGSILYSYSYQGTPVGTIKQLSNDQVLDKFNTIRLNRYKTKFGEDWQKYYPGDATKAHQSIPYFYNIPYYGIMVKKQGGRLIPRKR